MDNKEKVEETMDYVLDDVGNFGKHQIFHFILMIMPIVLSAAHSTDFVVTSSTDEHRCHIPECDVQNMSSTYDSEWLKNAVPFKNNRPEKCLRYGRSQLLTNNSVGHCSKTLFNKTDIIQCNEFIFKSDEHRIIKEFGIVCDENEYKLALVGTIKNIGSFLFMPLTGILSDKFGRMNVLVYSTFARSMFGVIKAFVSSYTWFVILDFLSAAVGTCSYIAAFILCVEWVSSKYRILSSSLLTVTFTMGEILLGVSAIYFKHYRDFILVLYTPALLTIFYFWLVPESVRWLVVTGQYDRALKILKQTARQNNRCISEKSMIILKNQCYGATDEECSSNNDTITSFFQHKVLVLRLITCSLVWIMIVFLYYGLSVNATKMADDDNKYLTYITTVVAEVPAALIVYFLLKYMGRRTSICTALIIAGTSIILSAFVPTNYTLAVRIILFTGMCATSTAFSILYVFSAEMWPTKVRNTLMNLCSMGGRFGSIFAPLAILLGQIMPTLPLLMFGSVGLLCGFIIFLLPETKDKKLPDTIKDACRL